MSIREASIQVLHDAAQPLTAQQITEQLLSQGLWRTQGKTPSATVAALLYTDIKKHGDRSAFRKIGPNVFALRDGTPALPATPEPVPPLPPVRTAGQCSFTDAAEKVLTQFGNKKPMHYRRITEKALELGLVSTAGKTPEATMYSQIITEIRRHQKRGDQPRFVQHGRGYLGLSCWMGQGLRFEIEQHNKRVRQALHKRLLAMDPTEFENFVAYQLLEELGFKDIEVTRRSKDGGIDVRGTLIVGDAIRTRMAVQVKRWQPKAHVQSNLVREVRGSLGPHEQALIITTSDFTAGARDEGSRANAVPVALMNGEQLVALLARYGIGVTSQPTEILDLDEGDLGSALPS